MSNEESVMAHIERHIKRIMLEKEPTLENKSCYDEQINVGYDKDAKYEDMPAYMFKYIASALAEHFDSFVFLGYNDDKPQMVYLQGKTPLNVAMMENVAKDVHRQMLLKEAINTIVPKISQVVESIVDMKVAKALKEAKKDEPICECKGDSQPSEVHDGN